MMLSLLLPFLLLSVSSVVYGTLNCSRPRSQLLSISSTEYVVRFNSQPCDADFDYKQSPLFCENSGWGDEEASVACRMKNSMYGIGGYLKINSSLSEVGYSYVNCSGSEEGLEECTIGNLTSHNCSLVALILQCLNEPQVVVLKAEEYRQFNSNFMEVAENDTAQLCVTVWGPLTETVHVLVETNDSGLALGNYDYHPLNHTIIFEPTDLMRSQLHCLEIEIIDDLLPEGYEMFSVLLSTNSSAVDLNVHQFDIFIQPNNESCLEGSVTVVSDVNNSSLQLVEMCNNKSVWSPVCDINWTLQDATIVCRELGHQDTTVRYSVLNKETFNFKNITIKCEDNHNKLYECPVQNETETACRYVLVQCSDGGNDSRDNGNDTNINNENGNENENITESTTDKVPEVTEALKGDGVSVGVVTGAIAATLAPLVLIILAVVLILLTRLRNKNIDSTKTVEGTPSEVERNGGQCEKHLDNPTYNSNLEYPPSSQVDDDEHNFVNPLYDVSMKLDRQPSVKYAVLECPDYAEPHLPTTPAAVAHTSSKPEIPETHDYDYADTPEK